MKKILIILLTVVATLITPPAFASNRVLSLDGDGDYVEMADSESLNAINSQVTMEAWIKAAKYTGAAPIVFKEDELNRNFSNRSYYLCLQKDGSIFLGSAPTGIQRIYLGSTDGLIALNTWYHVAGVVDTESGVMRIFINGVEVARQDSGRDIYMSALPLRIGWTHEEIYSPFAGQMDEVRIWNIARTQEEIQATMHKSLSGKEQGLVGYWRFDAIGDTVTGSSPASADGKLMGDAHLAEAELPEPGELVIPTVLSGLITNESGRPVPDASVRLEQNGEEKAQAQTDRNGNYWIAISPPVGDLYNLSATSGELGDWRYNIRLREGEHQKINLTLKEAISIEGTIMMLDDITPHVAVPVQAIVAEKVIDRVLTDEKGRYRFINLRPGQYNVRCYKPGGYVYYEGEGTGEPEGRKAGRPESQEASKPVSLRVEEGKTLKNIDFRFPQFKKGTWRHYDTTDGLASIAVNTICPAPDGTMWFSTGARSWGVGSGVSRYDGQEFVTFTTKDGLAHNAVNSIYCDQNGVMWFGTYGGVSRYDGREFVNFTVRDGLANNEVGAVHGTPDGILWFGTWGDGVFRYDGSEFLNFTIMDGLPSNDVWAIHDTPDGALWFGMARGVSRYDGGTFTRFTTDDGLVNNVVISIHSTPDGILWFGTRGGVSRYDARGMGDSATNSSRGMGDSAANSSRGMGDFPHFVNFTTKDGLANNVVWAIHSDPDGVVWFGTEGGVSRYDGEGFVNFTKEDGLMVNHVEAIYRGADGSLWFGTVSGGVSRYDEGTFTRFTEDDGLANNWIRAIHRAPDGMLWLGTGGGVSRYDARGQALKKLEQRGVGDFPHMGDSPHFINFTTEDGLADNSVGVIHGDADGALWFGTGDVVIGGGGGVSRYDPSAEKEGGKCFVTFTTEDGLADNSVADIHSTPGGALWFGTRGGVSRYDGKKFIDLTKEMGLDAGEPVRSIHSAPDGALWLASEFDGIFRYDGKDLMNLTTKDGLADNVVFDIYDNNHGVLWIATYGGVSRYDARGMGDSPHFLNFTVEDGLPGNIVMNIYEASDGTLWFGGEGGVSGYDGIAWTSLDGRDGLPGTVVRSIEQDPDGDLWIGIGTGEGLIHYHRDKTKPKARIVSVRTDKDYTEDTYRGLSQDMIPSITTGRRVTIGCRAIDFKTIPEKRQYRYRVYETGDVRHETSDMRLETVESRSPRRDVSSLMSDVPYNPPTKEAGFDWTPEKPGAYVFQVQAIDRDLNYSEPASVTLKVVSPFYMRAGFLVPTVGSGAILLATSAILATALVKRRRQVHAYQRLAVEELQDAHEMQMSLLPEAAPPVEGMEIAGRSIPANTVGGDFFDYLSLPDGKVGIAIADVSGKGLRAAMNATMTNGMLHEVATIEASCGGILSRLNEHLYPLMEKQMFTALSFAIIEQDAGVIQWSSAAQPLPLIKRSDGVSEAGEDGELPLSIAPDVKYPDYELELQTGDVVIFYTDGIIEAENEAEEMYGSERLLNLVTGIDSAANAEGVIQAIFQDVAHFVGDAERYDDMTVVVVKKL